jgi:hypothetical protein
MPPGWRLSRAKRKLRDCVRGDYRHHSLCVKHCLRRPAGLDGTRSCSGIDLRERRVVYLLYAP